MKSRSLILVSLLVGAVAACQRQVPAEKIAAGPTPSPQTASAAPLSTAPGDTLPAAGPETTPAPQAATTPQVQPSGRIDPATGVRIETDNTPPSSARRSTSSRRQRTARSESASRPSDLPASGAAPSSAQSYPDQGGPQRPTPDVTTTVQRTEQDVVLPAGTELPIRLDETLGSDSSRPEQEVSARVAEDVRENGRVVLPAGAEVRGHVITAQPAGRVSGRAHLVVAFDEIHTHGRTYPIQSARWDITAESARSRNEKIAGGAAAAGAIIGAITGGGKGALKGAILGGAAGGAAVLIKGGKEVELPRDVVHRITLRRPLRIVR